MEGPQRTHPGGFAFVAGEDGRCASRQVLWLRGSDLCSPHQPSTASAWPAKKKNWELAAFRAKLENPVRDYEASLLLCLRVLLLPATPSCVLLLTSKMGDVEMASNKGDDGSIKPEAVTTAVDTSQWPLLLKNYDRRQSFPSTSACPWPIMMSPMREREILAD